MLDQWVMPQEHDLGEAVMFQPAATIQDPAAGEQH